MKALTLLLIVALAACQGEAPPAPTSAETEQLDEAEDLLNGLAEEEAGQTNRAE